MKAFFDRYRDLDALDVALLIIAGTGFGVAGCILNFMGVI